MGFGVGDARLEVYILARDILGLYLPVLHLSEPGDIAESIVEGRGRDPDRDDAALESIVLAPGLGAGTHDVAPITIRDEQCLGEGVLESARLNPRST